MALRDQLARLKQQKNEAEAYEQALPERKNKMLLDFNTLLRIYTAVLEPLQQEGALTYSLIEEIITHKQFGLISTNTLLISASDVEIHLSVGDELIMGFHSWARLHRITSQFQNSQEIMIYYGGISNFGWAYKTADLAAFKRANPSIGNDHFIPVLPASADASLELVLTGA